MRYISKQWTINFRDFFKSLFYGAVVPFLVTIQGVIEAGGIGNIDWKLIGQIAIGSIIAHLIRKFTEPTKTIEVKTLDNNGGSNPPPMGDPLKPIK